MLGELLSRPLPALRVLTVDKFSVAQHDTRLCIVAKHSHFVWRCACRMATDPGGLVMGELLSRPPPALRGLIVEKLSIAAKHVAELAVMTQLTALHLVSRVAGLLPSSRASAAVLYHKGSTGDRRAAVQACRLAS